MDTLIQQYSRPAAEGEGYEQENEEMQLAELVAPSLSLKFALPPVPQVCSAPYEKLL
jgi:20S proteasome subunit beta 5